MTLRVCPMPGCGALSLTPGKCPDCRAEHERSRPARGRGYGSAHDAERRRWTPLVAAGRVRCWRCGGRLDPKRWHLGHDDVDRSKYRGPECVRCNLGAAGRAAHQ